MTATQRLTFLAIPLLVAACTRVPPPKPAAPAPPPPPPPPSVTFLDVGATGAVVQAGATTAPGSRNVPAPGALYVEPSTLHSLGFEWELTGDDNRNARVAVSYRRTGATDWRDAMDLLRIHHEINFGLDGFADPDTYVCSNRFAGSILFLEPAQAYEVLLTLSDPDTSPANTGAVQQVALRVRTKTAPTVFAGGRRLHVYPEGYAGARIEPAFDDLNRAYRVAEPGDRILLHAGTYTGERKLTRSGTRERPIVIAPAGDGPVLLTSESSGLVVAGDYHWIEGLTFRVSSVAVRARERVAGLTVSRCRFEGVQQVGVQTQNPHSRDILVTDCEFVGTEGSWHDRDKTSPYKSVWVAGQGVDICYNRVRNEWDGLSVSPSRPTGEFGSTVCAIDFYNNDVAQIVDDNEADEGQHNIRFFNNRFVDTYVGLSAQPVHGGPCYFVRNLQYNVKSGKIFKLNIYPAGLVILNNTCVSGCREREPGTAFFNRGYWNSHIYNNVFLGIAGDTMTGGPRDPSVSRMDYNGYRPTGIVRWFEFDEAAQRAALQGGDGSTAAINHARTLRFPTLAAFAAATSNEQHAVTLDFTDFAGLGEPKPEPANNDPDTLDPRPTASSPVIDAGKIIPNITDGYAGQAPDIGAFEAGQPLPHYGPRPTAP
ncbi:MAG: hypothetical protein K8T26_06745 [Lentisphaerae bacterium]|nr:hypothetical protein [Lentisphaerota bacterium]